MASNVRPRVRIQDTAEAGEAILIRTLVSHPMESGQRTDNEGNVIPRSIINRFTCEFNGESVLDVKMEPGISANPYFEFEATVPESGEFRFTWYDDDGSIYEDIKTITVN